MARGRAKRPFRDGWYRAMRRYHCDFCKDPIAKGDRYFRVYDDPRRDLEGFGGRFCNESCAGQFAWAKKPGEEQLERLRAKWRDLPDPETAEPRGLRKRALAGAE